MGIKLPYNLLDDPYMLEVYQKSLVAQKYGKCGNTVLELVKSSSKIPCTGCVFTAEGSICPQLNKEKLCIVNKEHYIFVYKKK